MKKPDFKALGGKIKASYKTRNWRVGSYSVIAAIIVVAIAVVVNVLVSSLPSSSTQLDMTPEQLYSISGETEQILAALDKDVDIYWVVQSGYEDTVLTQVLNRYAEYSHVTVSQVDPVKYPNFLSSYTTESASNNSVLVSCGDRSLYIPYSDIWTCSDAEQAYYYYYYYGTEYTDTFAGEQQITSAIGYVTSEDLPVMYVLTGHGEYGLSDDTESAVQLQNVQVEELNLLTMEAVPEDCALLYISGPQSDISDSELEQLRDYVQAGGKLLVTTSYTEEDMSNFTALLSDWGIEVKYGYVLESDSRYFYYGYIDLLLPQMQSHSITSPINEAGYSIMFPDSQAFSLDSPADEITLSSLLKSSSGSYLKTNLSQMTDYEQTAEDESGAFTLAAAGSNSASGAQIVVFGSDVFMESDYSEMVSGANSDLFLNAVDWLCEKTDAISIHAKTISSDYISYTDSGAGFVKLLLVGVVPLAFLAMGVVVFVKRRRK